MCSSATMEVSRRFSWRISSDSSERTQKDLERKDRSTAIAWGSMLQA